MVEWWFPMVFVISHGWMAPKSDLKEGAGRLQGLFQSAKKASWKRLHMSNEIRGPTGSNRLVV